MLIITTVPVQFLALSWAQADVSIVPASACLSYSPHLLCQCSGWLHYCPYSKLHALAPDQLDSSRIPWSVFVAWHYFLNSSWYDWIQLLQETSLLVIGIIFEIWHLFASLQSWSLSFIQNGRSYRSLARMMGFVSANHERMKPQIFFQVVNASVDWAIL